MIIAGNIDGNFEWVDLKLTETYVIDFVLSGPPDLFSKLGCLSYFLINDGLFYYDFEVKIFLKFLSNKF